MRYRLLIPLASMGLACCASLPDVTASYYFPKASTHFDVVQTIGCSPKESNRNDLNANREIRSVITVAVTTTYSADYGWIDSNGNPRTGVFRFRKLNGKLFDGDATVSLTPDGRLAGINSATTGQVAGAAKSLVTLAGAVTPMLVASMDISGLGHDDAVLTNAACEKVDQFSAKSAVPGKESAKDPAATAPALTLTYSLYVSYDVPERGHTTLIVDHVLSPGYEHVKDPQTSITLVPDVLSKAAWDALDTVFNDGRKTDLLGKEWVDTEQMRINIVASNPEQGAQYLDPPINGEASGRNRFDSIELPRIALVNLGISGHVADLRTKAQLWAGTVSVPTRQIRTLPIPTPSVAGKTAFGLTISDAGSVLSVHYGANSGTQEVSDALSALAAHFKPDSDADRAKEIQGRADLIAQQQRLVGCQTNPAQCK